MEENRSSALSPVFQWLFLHRVNLGDSVKPEQGTGATFFVCYQNQVSIKFSSRFSGQPLELCSSSWSAATSITN